MDTEITAALFALAAFALPIGLAWLLVARHAPRADGTQRAERRKRPFLPHREE
ncbi:MAG: hypothetical protein JWP29_1554 [Rhodoferax sp.]|nr:hypothetical protein [Rhodoferax sp.]